MKKAAEAAKKLSAASGLQSKTAESLQFSDNQTTTNVSRSSSTDSDHHGGSLMNNVLKLGKKMIKKKMASGDRSKISPGVSGSTSRQESLIQQTTHTQVHHHHYHENDRGSTNDEDHSDSSSSSSSSSSHEELPEMFENHARISEQEQLEAHQELHDHALLEHQKEQSYEYNQNETEVPYNCVEDEQEDEEIQNQIQNEQEYIESLQQVEPEDVDNVHVSSQLVDSFREETQDEEPTQEEFDPGYEEHHDNVEEGDTYDNDYDDAGDDYEDTGDDYGDAGDDYDDAGDDCDYEE